MVALACERPADHEVPLRRYSLSELTVEVANRLPSDRRRALTDGHLACVGARRPASLAVSILDHAA